MKATKLYKKLEKDFIIPGLKDDWAGYIGSVLGSLDCKLNLLKISP